MSAIEPDHFFILPLEKIDTNSRSALYQKRNPGIELILVTSGYLIRECNFNAIRINPKDIHLSVSQQPTSISETRGELQGWYCRLDHSFLDQIYIKEDLENEVELISSFLYQYPLRLTNKVFQRLSANFSSMTQLYNEREIDYTLIHAYLAASIYEIKKIMKENSLDLYPAKAFSITKKYNDLLVSNIEKEQSIEFYAGALKITPNHLNKSVKSVTGKTAIALLNEMRLTEAKSRLKYTELSISEIAYQLGFEDQSYFSRFFKKATGNSPVKFRKI
ncbi:MAG: helix-turn-helix domain-containing protein [Candidatus Symbiothrix sp.]|jgi:AraC-like DNA-binding protein|nr:helix-turn-helix domain-containing protein [Candidatus Symbiothrix sp.]